MKFEAPRKLNRITRGVMRHFTQIGLSSLSEFSPTKGLRVDIVAIGLSDEIWIVECKSSQGDFKSDKKWQNYLDWCDRYFWAVDAKFPINILPSDTGLIIADAYDASIFREAPLNKLSAARRKKITKSIARSACNRLLTHTDPKI
jgi:hypothetical protein|tara:strand:- start:79 stop:513 length:435 start_codon:yes stop_codon:yes gene_type:complete